MPFLMIVLILVVYVGVLLDVVVILAVGCCC